MAFSIFGGKPAAPAAKSTQQQQTQTQQQQTVPLAQFAEMFTKLQEVSAAQAKAQPALPALDPKQLGELLAKTQMAPQITEQHLEAIQAGGSSAVTALSQLLNQTAQAATMQAIMAAQRMTQTGVETATGAVTSQLPQMLRDQLFQQSLAAKLPDLNNPAVAPLVEVVRAGIAASNPTLTPEQLTEQAVQYFQGFGSLAAPAPAADPATQAPAETDFMALFNITPPAAATAATTEGQ